MLSKIFLISSSFRQFPAYFYIQTHTRARTHTTTSYRLSYIIQHLINKPKLLWKEWYHTLKITRVNLHFRIRVFIRLPNNSDMVWDRYFTPFSYGLWLAVAFAVCAIGVCLALTNYGHERNQNLSVSAILFYIHACFCQQGQSYK